MKRFFLSLSIVTYSLVAASAHAAPPARGGSSGHSAAPRGGSSTPHVQQNIQSQPKIQHSSPLTLPKNNVVSPKIDNKVSLPKVDNKVPQLNKDAVKNLNKSLDLHKGNKVLDVKNQSKKIDIGLKGDLNKLMRPFNHANYHVQFGKKANFGFWYQGRNHRHWSYCYWDIRYGCLIYWDPCVCSYYYWCEPATCFYPVTYCPHRTYSFCNCAQTVDCGCYTPVEVTTPVVSCGCLQGNVVASTDTTVEPEPTQPTPPAPMVVNGTFANPGLAPAPVVSLPEAPKE